MVGGRGRLLAKRSNLLVTSSSSPPRSTEVMERCRRLVQPRRAGRREVGKGERGSERWRRFMATTGNAVAKFWKWQAPSVVPPAWRASDVRVAADDEKRASIQGEAGIPP